MPDAIVIFLSQYPLNRKTELSKGKPHFFFYSQKIIRQARQQSAVPQELFCREATGW